MSIIPISTIEFSTNQVIEFNIEFGKNGKDEKLKEIYDRLIFVEDLSYGKVYSEEGTEHYWFINPTGTTARRITLKRLLLFRQWDKRALLLSDEKLENLIQIGGLPTMQYSLVPKHIQFPAKIKTNDGKEIDFCLFLLSPAPPFQSYFKKIILIDEVESIQPSEFALSHELRLASLLAEEMRMAFYPFMVRTASGRLLTYNGLTNFASDGEMKGNDILNEVPFTYDNFDKVQNDIPFDNITVVVGKWDGRLDELFNQYTSILEIKTNQKRLDREIAMKAKRVGGFLPLKKKWWQKFF